MKYIKVELLQCFIDFSVKCFVVVLLKVKFMSYQQLAEELHKSIIEKFEKRKVHSSFRDNFWGDHLVDIQLISNYNQGCWFLLCTINIFSK